MSSKNFLKQKLKFKSKQNENKVTAKNDKLNKTSIYDLIKFALSIALYEILKLIIKERKKIQFIKRVIAKK